MAGSKSTRSVHKPTDKESMIREKEAELAKVVDRHDDLIREKFHMENYVTMIKAYDPAVAKRDRSQVFLDYKAPFDLVSRFALPSSAGPSTVGGSRRTTRRAIASVTSSLSLPAPPVMATPPSRPVNGHGVGKRHGTDLKGKGKMKEEDMEMLLAEEQASSRRKSSTVNGDLNGQGLVPPKKSHKKATWAMEEREAESAAGMVNGGRGSKRKEAPPPPSPPPPSKKKRKTSPTPPSSASLAPSTVTPDPFEGVDVPPLRLTHHEQGIEQLPKHGGDLGAYLTSYVMLEDKDVDPKAQRDTLAAKIRVKGRVRDLERAGRLLPFFYDDAEEDVPPPGAPPETAASIKSRSTVGTNAFKPPAEPKRLPGHRDHLILHALQVRNAMLNEYRLAITNCRKLARAVQGHWEREQGKEERLRKEEERLRRAKGREMIKGMKAKWKLAYKIISARQAAKAKAEQERIGQEHLHSILNRSLGMLGDQRESSAGTPEPTEAESAVEAEEEGDEIAAPEGCAEDEQKGNTEPEGKPESESVTEAETRERSADKVKLAATPPLSNDVPSADLSEDAPSVPTAASDPQELVSASAPVEDADPDAEDEDFGDDEDNEEQDYQMDVKMEEEEEGNEDDSEDEGLLADAELPIEELLKRYGYGGDVAGSVPSEILSRDQTKAEETDEGVAEPDLPEDHDDDGPRRSVRARKVRTIRDASSPTPLEKRYEEPKTPELVPDQESGEEEEDESSEDSEVGEEEQELEEDEADHVRVPFLLRADLRPYQKAGLDWLARSYREETNVILADDMGLGKTVQTIALLAHLACDLGEWGPHLIIVPTSVILNWEMEFKKFLPGFRILTYYGTQKERKEKRKGWYTEGTFQVIITSYQIVLADQHIFKMRQWHYMILDEAHNIKNFRSQRWQTLLGFKSVRRLLLTGTPLQNNLMELWSLLYFLMPHGLSDQLTEAGGFANHREFIEWFSNPMDKAVETGDVMNEETRATVSKLHLILRPYMLRRLKSEVETQLPGKFEHVINCTLSKRQRLLYDEFITRASTRESLQSGGYLGVANVLMKLRQVCNHPDLFEVRPIRTSFAMEHSVGYEHRGTVDLLRGLITGDEGRGLGILGAAGSRLGHEDEYNLAARSCLELDASDLLLSEASKVMSPVPPPNDTRTLAGWNLYRAYLAEQAEAARWELMARVNRVKCAAHPTFGLDLRKAVDIHGPKRLTRKQQVAQDLVAQDIWRRSTMLRPIWGEESATSIHTMVQKFAVATPAVVARDMPSLAVGEKTVERHPEVLDPDFDSLHFPSVKLQIAFPDSSLLQYDCGKLQLLAGMLRDLKAEGHRVLIFTVMTKMLDILEIFLNHAGHRYFRLDGSTKVEDRLILTERFNTNPKVFAFIASTRSGGVGINLTGADTVIFYDNDFNPAMDKQAMDRAHRIGQTREVNIYRLVTDHTVEENMLRKANQKRMLDELVIQKGDFTTDYFAKTDLRDYLGDEILQQVPMSATLPASGSATPAGGADTKEDREIQMAFAQAEDEEDAAAARFAAMDNEADAADFGVDERKSATPAVTDGKAAQKRNAGRVSEEPARAATPDINGDPGTPLSMDVDEEEEYDEGEPGAIDEYMLRFVEWEFGV